MTKFFDKDQNYLFAYYSIAIQRQRNLKKSFLSILNFQQLAYVTLALP